MKKFDNLFGTEEAFEQIYRKHFKKSYCRKPTKRLKNLIKRIKNENEISFDSLF